MILRLGHQGVRDRSAAVLTHVLKRLALAGPVLLGITLDPLFVAIRLLPGDPAVVMAGDLAPGEYVERLRRGVGLDQPVYIQYVLYLGRVVRGDLGRSSKSFRPVADEIRDRYPYALQLAVAGMAVAAVLGISAGAVSAVHRGSLFDHGSMVVALFGVSVPVFWLGLVLILIFAVHWQVLPAGGAGRPSHLVLPALTLGASAAGILARMTRASNARSARERLRAHRAGQGVARAGRRAPSRAADRLHSGVDDPRAAVRQSARRCRHHRVGVRSGRGWGG